MIYAVYNMITFEELMKGWYFWKF